MIILGIDPGMATVGYGIVNYDRNVFRVIQYGVIKTEAGLPASTRLLEISNDIGTLIETYKPDCAAVEELFFNSNHKTGIQVAQSRGVILLECCRRNVPLYEYTPLQVKQAVVGYGRAEKKQVMEMTRLILKLDKIPKPDDAADALAIAICHGHSSGVQGKHIDNST
ncbi:MAG: crossover junction endodeoxyribonuclease RuvC [Clostridiales bacterium]|nr:crossover junction endodeoxyribonuclease RuvC [Clostridiales bacterium]